MPTIQAGLPAREMDRRLRAAVAELHCVERRAVLWFAEVLERKLYRDLGFGSIQQYAELSLGFGPGKTAQFVRLAGALRDLPRLRASVARGELTWTQARTVAGVATPRTEQAWLTAAKGTSSRGLEHQVRVARRRARVVGGGREQVKLGLESPDTRGPGHKEESEAGSERVTVPPVPPVESLPLPRGVHLRFSPEQGARYEALLEAARKQGARGEREELLLAALETLVTGGRARTATKRGPARAAERTSVSPYQVLVQLCPSCAGGSVVTGRGAEPLDPRELRAILCDARVRRPGQRNGAGIPPRVRRAVLERDGHRCRSAGCGDARFLAVHHRTPREAGGTNDPENLLTLCASCHRAVHGHHRRPGHEAAGNRAPTNEGSSRVPEPPRGQTRADVGPASGNESNGPLDGAALRLSDRGG